MITPEEIAASVAEYAGELKALDIVQLDLREVISYTDYFLICSGRSDRQVKGVECLSKSDWVLMDYVDVIVHVFTPEVREFYRLETLWGEAPSVTLAPAAALAAS